LSASPETDHASHNPTPATTGKVREKISGFFLSESCQIQSEQIEERKKTKGCEADLALPVVSIP